MSSDEELRIRGGCQMNSKVKTDKQSESDCIIEKNWSYKLDLNVCLSVGSSWPHI
jgi:hypothetical protein